METDSCLFLSEWESARRENHSMRRGACESELNRQQLQLQSSLTSMSSWLAVVETRRRLPLGAVALSSSQPCLCL